MEKTQNFTEGKILPSLLQFVIPVLIAMFLQTMYGAVDLMVVGKFGTAADVSAVSTGSQIMMTITMFISAISLGITVYLGKIIGAGEKDIAGEIIGSGIFLFAVISVAVTVIMLFTSNPIAKIMHTPIEAFDRTVSYIFICSAGMIFIVAYNLVGSIFRGIGDSKTPLLTVTIACIFNIIGDIVLVAGFRMGTAGAAIATVGAQAISVILSVIFIRKKQFPFLFTLKYIYPNKNHISKVLKLGVPVALQDFLVSISFLVIIAIVNSLGLTASAGVGVAEKLCGFLMLVPSAFMQAMSSFTAQNIGAAKPARAIKALLCGIGASLTAGVIMAIITFAYGDVMAGIFANEPDVIMAAAEYLKAYAIDCILTSFLFCFMGFFNGLGSTKFVMLQGIAGAFLVRLPFSWLMSRLKPVSLFRIGLATPMSSLMQIILCALYFARWYNRSKDFIVD